MTLRRPALALTLAAIALVGAVAVVAGPRVLRRAEPKATIHATQPVVATVTVATPTRAPATVHIALPGSIQAIQEIAIYARVDGYLKARRVDLGARVEPGQILAEIDTPELDQQLLQGRAMLAQAQAVLGQARASLTQARATVRHNNASVAYNRTTLERWRLLKGRELVAQQDVDDRQVAYDASRADLAAAEANVQSLEANVTAAEANVGASQASVTRLVDLQAFHTVRAPFSGIITVRNVDNGALISGGSGPNTVPLFRLAQIDTLRVFVNVPQTFVASIARGLAAEIVVRELPRSNFRATVAGTAGALDPASRTLLTEVHLPNPRDVLRPGMYAEVKFQVTRKDPPLLVPSSALIVQAAGTQVATVEADGKVRLRRVELGRDFGATVEVLSGLDQDERIVVTPSDDLQDGALVNPVPAQAPSRRSS